MSNTVLDPPKIETLRVEMHDGSYREIGPNRSVFIIAEAGVNHGGNPDLALEMVDVAAQAGVDAVKFQTFSADELTTPHVAQAEYQRRQEELTQHEMLRRLELPRNVYPDLIDRCRQRGILFMSTPFDHNAARLLTDLGMTCIKVSSGELTNLPLLQQLSRFNLPLIVSTGMGTLAEVHKAVRVLQEKPEPSPFALLHCTSDYPTPPQDANLRAIQTLQEHFPVPVGYSDHTCGVHASVAAVVLGACIVEKHFTLSKTMPGPDHAASMDPAEMKDWVRCVRETEQMLGTGIKMPSRSEIATSQVVRRYLCSARPLSAGTILQPEDLTAKRCDGTILPAELENIVGCVLKRDLAAMEPIRPGDWT